jgi:hypothetical protein
LRRGCPGTGQDNAEQRGCFQDGFHFVLGFGSCEGRHAYGGLRRHDCHDNAYLRNSGANDNLFTVTFA